MAYPLSLCLCIPCVVYDACFVLWRQAVQVSQPCWCLVRPSGAETGTFFTSSRSQLSCDYLHFLESRGSCSFTWCLGAWAEKAPDFVGNSKGDESAEGEKNNGAQAPAPARPAKPEPSGSSLLAWAPRGRVAMSLSSWIIDFKNLVCIHSAPPVFHVLTVIICTDRQAWVVLKLLCASILLLLCWVSVLQPIALIAVALEIGVNRRSCLVFVMYLRPTYQPV